MLKLVRTQRTLPTRLEAVVAMAKQMVPGCDAAGVTLVVTGEPLTAAASDTVVLEVDIVQYATGQGPCLDTIAESNIVRVDLIERDLRYERFAPGALLRRSTAWCPSPRRRRAYRRSPQPVLVPPGRVRRRHRAGDGTHRELRRRRAVHLAPLRLLPGHGRGPEQSLEERAVIAQATGALVARNGWTAAESLDFLRDRAVVRGEPLWKAASAVLRPRRAGGPCPVRSDRRPDARPPQP